ncbi:MAG: hypothetical protein ABJM26_21980 [Anderseniella sp.]
MKKFTSTIVAFSIAAAFGGVMMTADSGDAFAAKKTKPMIGAYGKSYYKKAKARSSAVGRWEKRVAIKHGLKFSHWSRAKAKGTSCQSKFHQGNGKKLWTCTASAKPFANIKSCVSGRIVAKWKHPNPAKAKATARNTWEKLTAQNYGIKYSFYKNAKGKSRNCKLVSNGTMTLCTFKATPCK